MDIDNDIHECARCAEQKENIEGLEILVVALAFLGPIVGFLIGIFAAKRLIK